MIVRSLLHDAGAPTRLWAYAMLYATRLKNQRPARALGHQVPVQAIGQNAKNSMHIPYWGQDLIVLNENASKLDNHGEAGVYLGDSTEGPLILRLSTKKITVNRNIHLPPIPSFTNLKIAYSTPPSASIGLPVFEI